MAKKIELKHTKDTLPWTDILEETDTPEQHHDRLVEHRTKLFENNNKQIYNDLLRNYEEFSEQFLRGTDDEQIQLLNRFNQLKDFTGWMIGDFLLKIEDDISSGKKRGYNSLRDYLDKNEDLLGFGKTAGYGYVAARKNVTIEQFRRIGIRKAVAVASIPDPIVREEFIQQAMKPKMTEQSLKLAIVAYKTDLKEEKQVEKVKEQKKISKTVIYNMTSKGKNIIIEPQTFSVEIMQEALAAFEMQIKAWIKRKLDSED